MAFTSFTFIVFLAVVTVAYFALPRRFQWLCLLAASVLFYGTFGWAQLGYVLVTVVSTWAAGAQMGRWNAAYKQTKDTGARAMLKRQKKRLLFGVTVLNLGLLVAFKQVGEWFSLGQSWIAPLGISFYTLSALGYAIDVYRMKYEHEGNPARLALMLMCFLNIVQGPFVRQNDMGVQLRAPHAFDWDDLKLGSLRMLWGYMKKMVVADWLGVYVSAAMDAGSWGAHIMLVAVVFYTVQIYADFSGYMDIVCGAGRILGLRLPENFDNPLGSRSVAEYWRRWHMTLGAWYKDYVFFPISVSKGATRLAKRLRKAGKSHLAKLMPAILALAVVWPLTGLWHGASLNYLAWGLLNGACIVASMLLEPAFGRLLKRLKINPDGRFWRFFSLARTFVLLAILRIFVRVDSMGRVGDILSSLTRWPSARYMMNPWKWLPGIRKSQMLYVLVACVCAGVMFLVEARGNSEQRLLQFDKKPLWAKYFWAMVLLFSVLLFSATGPDVAGGFLYAAF